MSDGQNASIVAQGLQKQFGGKPVLRDLALTISPGALFGLFGPSGSGKSTCIHLCCGHLRPDGGSLRVLGEEPARFTRATRRRIGYAAQQFTLSPDLTAAANIAFAAGLYGLPEWRSAPHVRAALELVDLWDAHRTRARSLSGGMRRRLAQLQRRGVDAVVILPADAFATIVAGRQATIRVLYNQIDPVWQWVVPNFAVTMAGAINREIVLQAVGGQQANLAQAATDLARVDELLSLARRAADTWDRAEVARLLAEARARTGDLAAALDSLGPEAAPLRREVAVVQARIAAAEKELEQAGLLEAQPTGAPLRERLGLDLLAAQVGQLSRALEQVTGLPPEVVIAPLAVEARNVARLQPDIITYYAPSVLALLVQHIAVSMGALALVRERLSGAFELCAISPATGLHLLLGKYLAYVGFTLVVAAVVIAVLLLALGVPLLGSPWRFALALVMLAAASTGLGLACSPVATSERQAVQLSLLALLAVVFFSGFTLPLDALRQPALAIAYALPATYATMLLRWRLRAR